MALGKWIGGFLGFISGGPLGMLAGIVLGSLFDMALDVANTPGTNEERTFDGTYSRQRRYEGEQNSFRFSLLVLMSYIIKADGRIMHSEMEVARQFLRTNFGESAMTQGNDILLKLFEQQKQMGAVAFENIIQQSCQQIAYSIDYSSRLQLLNFLVLIAKADNNIANAEITALRKVAQWMGLSAADVDSMLNLGSSQDNLEAAYKVLGVSPSATDAEVKAAYRQLALKHHPDKVAKLGDDVRKAAEKKFKEINAAKDLIYKARGL